MDIHEIDLNKETATLISDRFAFDVEFVGRFFKDGNGFQSWNDVEIESIKLIQAGDENGQVDHSLSSDEESQIIETLEEHIRGLI